jgi:hypothetical protein
MYETRTVLGVSRVRVRQLVKAGQLAGHHLPDKRGPHGGKALFFRRADVFRLAAERAERAIEGSKRGSVAELDGRLVSRIFAYFSDGWTLPQIVIEEKLSPEVVRLLWVEYTTPLGQTPPPQKRGRRGRPRIVSRSITQAGDPVDSALRALGGLHSLPK